MKPSVHTEICRQALGEQVSAVALHAIVAANLKQDNLRGQVGHDEYHFDNNALAAGYAYIDSQHALIGPALSRGDIASAWSAFGRLTHAAQDFYSHTNYISLWLSRFGDGADTVAAAIDPVSPAVLSDPHLHSGRLYYPVEFFYFIPVLRRFVLSFLPRDSHAHMNLDSSERGPQFQYAFHAAVKRTRQEFEQLRSSLSPDLFKLFSAK